MILITNIKISLDFDFKNLKQLAANELKCDVANVVNATLYRKSVDARKKDNVHFCVSLLVTLSNGEEKVIKRNKNAQKYAIKPYVWKKCENKPQNNPVVIGFGPAGMFAALTLARAGLCPIVLERGADVDARTVAVKEFFNGGKLNPENNVQFGEGGAGTFSDGKLNSGIKNIRCRTVLEAFTKFGADSKILYEAKPHIGTDVLCRVVKNIREEIISLGGRVLFNTRLDDIITEDNRVVAVTAKGEKYSCDKVIIATGHSARDTFKMLFEKGVDMVQKPFAMGVRIEHLQSDINKSLYGEFWNHKALGAADYKLAEHLENGRGVYTFCMCPGGEVINASSEQGGLAVNGMSESRRDGKNANSALLVNVDPKDFESNYVLAGCELQEKIEKAAFALNNGAVPITTVGSFVFGKEAKIGKIEPTVKPEYRLADISKIFPPFITESLREGILRFDKKIKGFACEDAILSAPESRSSSPVRIVRGEDLQSVSVKGLYPCGEGAGYAGGIMSAAVDGMTVAERIIEEINL